MGQDSVEKSLSNFLLDIASRQKTRVTKLVDFLTVAEAKILDGFDLDNISIDQYSNLAKTVSELQKVTLDIMEVMRKLVAGNTKVPSSGDNESIDELAYVLRNMNQEELDALKEAISAVKPTLKLVNKK
jgi:hypothetical protein